MTLPTIHEVTSMFLYGSEVPPDNFIEDDLTTERAREPIDVDTDEFLDPDNGPGRFVVASNSAMMQRFFETAAADYASGVFSAHQDASTGIVTMSKGELDEIYGLTANNIWHGVSVDNKWIYDDLDDYAERTYIYGNISFKISEDVNFVVYPDGRLEVQNFSLEILNGNDFDWTTRVDDILTGLGNTVLRRAIDPSGIGQTVLLNFDAATPYTYTQDHFNDDVDRADSFSTVLNPISISRAMGGVINDLFEEGTIQTVMDGKLVLYGGDEADVIGPYLSRTGVNVSDPGLDLPNPLREHTDNGLIYVAGAGHDTVTGTGADDVLFGNGGADALFGGGADDFIFFDFADGSNVYGGAGRDVAVALGQDGVTVDMAEQGLECVIGCDGADTILVTEADQPVFAAGGGGADHFILDNLDTHGPRILWGGAGADVFEFQNGGRVSLAVVTIDGLTEEAFSRLTLADLGLGELDVSLLSAIIINPDATDRFYSEDGVVGTSSVNLGDWWDIGNDPDLLDLLVPGYGTPVSLDVRTSDVLGGSYSVQGVFRNEVRAIHEITIQYNYFDVTVRSDGGYEVVNTDIYEEGLIRYNLETESTIDTRSEVIEDALMTAEWVFAQWDEYDYGHVTSEYWTVQARSDIPTGPFYVVGGEFAGNVLSANGDLSGSLPDDPGPSPFDWLLAA